MHLIDYQVLVLCSNLMSQVTTTILSFFRLDRITL